MNWLRAWHFGGGPSRTVVVLLQGLHSLALRRQSRIMLYVDGKSKLANVLVILSFIR